MSLIHEHMDRKGVPRPWKGDGNVIYGPVGEAHIFKGTPDNFVRSGWACEIYWRINGIVSSTITRVARTKRTAARWRREIIDFDRAYSAGAHTFYVCDTDEELLTTIRRVWG